MITRQMLDKSDLTDGMSATQMEVLGAYGAVREFADAEPIVSRMDGTFPLYILVEGQAEVQGLFGEVVNVVSKGSLIGEIAFIDHLPRTADAVSKGKTRVIEMPESVMAELQLNHPDIAAIMLANVTRSLCRKIRTAQRLIDVQNVLQP